MSTRTSSSANVILPPIKFSELSNYFHEASKPRDKWGIGVEYEKIGIFRNSGQQLPYFGQNGIRETLVKLSEQYNWEKFEENGNIVALLKDGASITIEPGGQLELSTPILKDIKSVDFWFKKHVAEIKAVTNNETTAWIGTGLSPFQDIQDITIVPKERYNVMINYLPSKSMSSLFMMKATASVQVSLDYESEEDAGKKLFTAVTLSPFINSFYGNSPIYNGKWIEQVSHRGFVWSKMDKDRSGFLEDVLKKGRFSFDIWVDYLLNVPMMFYCIDDKFIPANGRSFKSYMESGFNGHFPDALDWEMHITSVFPEVRLKKFIEIRGADSNPTALATSVPALWVGLLYDKEVLNEISDWATQFDEKDRQTIFEISFKEGLAGVYNKKQISSWLKDILTFAEKGLRNISGTNLSEITYLDPLKSILSHNENLGQKLKRLYKKQDCTINIEDVLKEIELH